MTAATHYYHCRHCNHKHHYPFPEVCGNCGNVLAPPKPIEPPIQLLREDKDPSTLKKAKEYSKEYGITYQLSCLRYELGVQSYEPDNIVAYARRRLEWYEATLKHVENGRAMAYVIAFLSMAMNVGLVSYYTWPWN